MAEEETDEMEGPRVLGIGLGLFFLILLWAFAFIGILAFSRFSSFTSTIICTVTFLITAIAFALPRVPAIDKTEAALGLDAPLNIIYDRPFIARVILTVVMIIFLIVGGVSSLLKHCTEQIYAFPIRRKAQSLKNHDFF